MPPGPPRVPISAWGVRAVHVRTWLCVATSPWVRMVLLPVPSSTGARSRGQPHPSSTRTDGEGSFASSFPDVVVLCCFPGGKPCYFRSFSSSSPVSPSTLPTTAFPKIAGDFSSILTAAQQVGWTQAPGLRQRQPTALEHGGLASLSPTFP